MTEQLEIQFDTAESDIIKLENLYLTGSIEHKLQTLKDASQKRYIEVSTLTNTIPYSVIYECNCIINQDENVKAIYHANQKRRLHIQEVLETSYTINGTRYLKALARTLKSVYQLTLTHETIGRIGSIIGKSKVNQRVLFDITDKFNWYAGDFGDEDSCFWGGRALAKQMLMDNGGMALRLYELEEDHDGYARCWIAPSDYGYVMFNSYGVELDVMRIVISKALKTDTIKINNLINNGSSTELLWINSGMGYLINPPERTPGGIDLEIPEPMKCYYCGDYYDEDELMYCEDTEHYYCNCCWNQTHDTCNNCNEEHHIDEMTYIDGNYYCNQCRRELFKQCSLCNRFYPKEEMHEEEYIFYSILQNEPHQATRIYCEQCYAPRKCVICGELKNLGRTINRLENGGEWHCKTCYEIEEHQRQEEQQQEED